MKVNIKKIANTVLDVSITIAVATVFGMIQKKVANAIKDRLL